jgi:hypothetical protein
MTIDAEKIISETLDVFAKSGALERFKTFTDVIDEVKYKELHPQPLTPLDIKIDCKQFMLDITAYNTYFEQWGETHTHLPRYGLALINETGILQNNDPVNGSMMAWNKKHPGVPFLDLDFDTPTQVLSMPSLEPLKIFNDHWCRSNILKWHAGAEFYPHIDTVIPSLWFRLWGCTSTDGLHIRFYDETSGQMREIDNIEPGRIYIIDTSLIHDAYTSVDDTYQLFLSVKPSARAVLAKYIA